LAAFCVLLYFVLAFLVTQAHGQQVVTLPTSVMNSTMRITCFEGENASSLGSGTLIAKDDDAALAITCWHLFRDNPYGAIGVTFVNGERFQATRLGHDDQLDLALLEIQGVPSAAVVPIADVPPQVGSTVYSGGFGDSQGRFQAQAGSVNAYLTHFYRGRDSFVTTDQGRGDVIDIAGLARNGDSGGPMLDQNYRLAGVIFGSDKRAVSGTHCVELMQFIQRCPGGRCPVPQYQQQPPMRPVPPKPQPPAVAGCKCGDCCKENAAMIVKLEARIAILEGKCSDGSLRGPKGDKGDAGLAGEPGPRGPQGPPGLSADLSKLPPITFHNLDPVTGKPKGRPIVVHLGEDLGMVHQRTK
jgi:hypothetical protein